jgi:hypothetical protein
LGVTINTAVGGVAASAAVGITADTVIIATKATKAVRRGFTRASKKRRCCPEMGVP